MRDPAFGLEIPQQGTSCGVYATIIYYFTKALGPIFCFLLRSKVQGDRNEYLDS